MKIVGFGGNPPGSHNMGDGLYLVVSPKGKSVWRARVKIDGRMTWRTLAPADVHTDQRKARSLLRDLRLEIDAGNVEIGSLRGSTRVRSGMLLGELLRWWTQDKASPSHRKPWSERHYKKTIEKIDKVLGPIMSTPLQECSRTTINGAVARFIETGGSRDTGGRVWDHVKNAWLDAENVGNIPPCPLRAKPDAFRVSRETRFASYGANLESIRALYKGVTDYRTYRSVRQVGQLCILSGLRIGEIARIHIDEVDAGAQLLRIPRYRMKIKTGRRSAAFLVPMSEPIRQIVGDACLAASEDGWLFPGARTGKPVNSAGVENMFRALTGGAHVPHGCRTSLNSWAIERKYNPIACKTILDHSAFNDVTQTYTDVEFLEERRRILSEWGEAITGNAPSGNVVPLTWSTR